MTPTREMKERVRAKVQECCRLASDHFGINFDMPEIRYNLRGVRTAGKAYPKRYGIGLHPKYLAAYTDHYIENTVPHEVAHLVSLIVHGKEKMHRKYHEREWQDIMLMFGAEPVAKHSYNPAPVAPPSYLRYACECKDHYISPAMHRSILNGRARICRKCRARIHPATDA
jgi:SprT protein